jgi:endonuclease/exonuclease/phosphatase family metal-dependent hydrolase
MKIATWNLERGRHLRSPCPLQDAAIQSLRADIVVLTEPSAFCRSGTNIVTSPAERRGPRGPEAWVAIVASGVEALPLPIPYERMAVAARATVGERSIVVYGAVLPWTAVRNHAPYLVRPNESSVDVFERVLAEQAADVAELCRQYEESVVWAGDFNQTLRGLCQGGSAVRRAALERTLAQLDFVAWNAGAAHARPEMCAVDLICGPKRIMPAAQGRIDPVSGGTVMSDHAGYWVEL